MAALQVSRQHLALAVRQGLISGHHKAVHAWRQVLLLVRQVRCLTAQPSVLSLGIFADKDNAYTVLALDQLETHAQDQTALAVPCMPTQTGMHKSPRGD